MKSVVYHKNTRTSVHLAKLRFVPHETLFADSSFSKFFCCLSESRWNNLMIFTRMTSDRPALPSILFIRCSVTLLKCITIVYTLPSRRVPVMAAVSLSCVGRFWNDSWLYGVKTVFRDWRALFRNETICACIFSSEYLWNAILDVHCQKTISSFVPKTRLRYYDSMICRSDPWRSPTSFFQINGRDLFGRTWTGNFSGPQNCTAESVPHTKIIKI